MSEQIAAEVLETKDGPNGVQEQATDAKAQGAGEVDNALNANETDEQRHKRLGGWQRKIQKLERENEVLREMALTPREKPAEAKPVVAADDDPRPKSDDFDNYDEYAVALGRWGARQEYKDQKAKETAKAEESKKQSEEKTVKEQWDAKASEARKVHDDFDEVVSNPLLPITPAMAEAVMTEDNGTDVAYYLGTHEAEAQRISKLSPIGAAREIGKIAARLALESAPAKEEVKDPTPKPLSKAPVPITPVRKATAAPAITDPLEAAVKGDYATYEKLMNERDKKKRG